jgi:hypothetical protein
MNCKHTRVKGVFTKLLSEFQEIPLDKCDLVREAGLCGILPRTSDLEFVVIQPDNVCVRKLGNLTGRSTNAAPNVQDPHARLDRHLGCKEMLVSGE